MHVLQRMDNFICAKRWLRGGAKNHMMKAVRSHPCHQGFWYHNFVRMVMKVLEVGRIEWALALLLNTYVILTLAILTFLLLHLCLDPSPNQVVQLLIVETQPSSRPAPTHSPDRYSSLTTPSHSVCAVVQLINRARSPPEDMCHRCQ